MKSASRIVSGLLALLFVLPVLATLVTQVTPAHSPYLSALADLGGTDALAAKPTCQKMACDTSTNSCSMNLTTKCVFTTHHGTKTCSTVSC